MKTIYLVLTMLVVAGCAAPPSSQDADAAADGKKPDKQVVLDPAVQKALRVSGVRRGADADGILRFQVEVQNLLPKAKTYIYQVDWLDKDGASLGLVAQPLTWTLLAKETAQLTMAAPAPTAKDFRLKFSQRPK